MAPDPRAHEVAMLTGAGAGDPEAVRALLDEAGPAVYGFVYARVGANQPVAEDVVQETFIEAVRSAHTFRGDAALRTWLCAIARRRLARHYEAERRDAVVRSGLAAVPSDPRGADQSEQAELERRDQVTRALGRLSPLHRQVLVLKYLDDLSVEDVARELGRSRVQVQSLLQRARAGLREQLEVSRG